MADEQLLKSVRIVQPDSSKKIDSNASTNSNNYTSRIRNGDTSVRLDVYQKGRRKYAVLKFPNTYFPDITEDYKFEKVDRSMSDDDVIKDALFLLKRRAVDNGYGNFEIFSSGDDLIKNKMILQDPWKDSPPTSRHYGFTYYYLNDGSQVHIEWIKDVYSVGSKFDDADGFVEKRITYSPYSKSNGTDGLSADLRDQSDASTRNLVKLQRKDSTFDWADKIEYSDQLRYAGTTEDSSIINSVISNLKSQITRFDGSDSKLALCDPDTEYCKLIRHVDFNAEPKPTTTDDSASKDLATGGGSQSSDKTKLFLVGLPDTIELKAGENLPDFSVHVNKIYTPPEENINNGEIDEDVELDPEYQESPISIEDEAEIKFLLELNAEDGESGTDTPSSSGSTVDLNGPALQTSPGGGGGVRRFQKKMVVNGVTVYNGELPANLVAKLDFSSIKLEKHAVKQLNAMNKEFKAKFGVDIAMSGGNRSFDVQNSIFDWAHFDKTGKARKIGTNGGTAAAKPGTSQHGWGLAIDTSGMGDKGSAKFDFLEQIGAKYGWVNPGWAKGSGAGHEPWHREYIGKDAFKNDLA
jgi:hypothetical protein